MKKLSLSKILESITKDKTITCTKCNWDWKESETEEFDKYVCHKCDNDMSSNYKTPK